jgi:hypothetical protein
MSAPFRDPKKWPFIEPYGIILGNSAGYVKHPGPSRRIRTRRPSASIADHFQKSLEKMDAFGNKGNPVLNG